VNRLNPKVRPLLLLGSTPISGQPGSSACLPGYTFLGGISPSVRTYFAEITSLDRDDITAQDRAAILLDEHIASDGYVGVLSPKTAFRLPFAAMTSYLSHGPGRTEPRRRH
jgi:hypothetical protein